MKNSSKITEETSTLLLFTARKKQRLDSAVFLLLFDSELLRQITKLFCHLRKSGR